MDNTGIYAEYDICVCLHIFIYYMALFNNVEWSIHLNGPSQRSQRC